MTTEAVSASASGGSVTSGNEIDVVSGGTAISFTVSSSGTLTASHGGLLVSMMVLSGGTSEERSGGVGSGSVVAGKDVVLTGGSTSSETIAVSGVEYLSGGSATHTVVDGGELALVGSVAIMSGEVFFTPSLALSAVVEDGGAILVSASVDSGALIQNGEEVVHGGVSYGTVLNASGSFNGLSGAVQIVDEGGDARSTVISAGSQLFTDSATAESTVLISGEQVVLFGSVATGTTVGSGSFQEVASGGTMIDTTIGSFGTVQLLGDATALGTIVFNGRSGFLLVSSATVPEASISGFAPTDTIDMASELYVSGGTASWSGDVLTVTDGGTSYDLNVAGDYAGATFDLVPDSGSGTDIVLTTVPCFAAGTRILTTQGEVPVDHIAVGGLVVTISGETLPVTWVGSRQVDCYRHPRPTLVFPVRIKANAFADNQPSSDLLVSPDHAVFSEGALIPIRCLVNNMTISQVETNSVTYFHIELINHAVIWANGLPTESYLDTGDRSAFAVPGALVQLHPSFGPEASDVTLVIDALGCAPFRVTGAEVDRTRTRLRERAEVLLCTSSSLPALSSVCLSGLRCA